MTLAPPDQEPPELPSGHEHSKAAFEECLQLVARAHEQELQQLISDNQKLRRQLATTEKLNTQLQQGAPSTGGTSANADRPIRPPTVHWALANDTRSSHVPPHTPPALPGLREVAAGRGSVGDGIMELSLSEVEDSCKAKLCRFPLMSSWEPMDIPVGTGPGRSTMKSLRRNYALRRTTQIQQLQSEDEQQIQKPPRATEAPRPGTRKGYISYPSSPGRLLWDMIGAVLILYDLLAIPLQAFDPPESFFMNFMDWFTLVFWTLNIPMSLQVGFVSNGVTYMEFDKICFNYLKTWFVIDMIVVVPDWVFTLTSLGTQDKNTMGESVKLLRMLRLIRMVRLLRLLKLGRILRSLNDLIETEYTNIMINIVKMIMLLLVINHYIGCFWYLIGTSQGPDRRDTWLVHHNFDAVQWEYKYLTSFHWAITQFTPSSMHVQPQNIAERLFAVLVVVFALVGFSYVVGSITGSLTQLRGLQEETYKQFWMMRRYLKQNHVPLELSARITRYLEHAWQTQRQKVQLKDYKIFSLLSEQLLSELRCEIWMPFVRVHELFQELSEVSSLSMRRIATLAMHRKALAAGDHVFTMEKATQMYILVNGCMVYKKPSCKPIEVDKSKAFEDFIAEPVIWTPGWVHLGSLTATSETEVLTLDPDKFLDIVRRSPECFYASAKYGEQYVRKLSALEDDELSDILHFEISRPNRRATVRTSWL